MEWLFGHQKTPKEIIREHQRAINKSIREMDREKARLEAEEKKTIVDIKKLAREGQMGAAKIQAKNLVRTRNYITKFIKMRAQLQAVSLRIVTLKSTASMTDAMRGVVKAMMIMNRQVNTPAMARVMAEFERQSEFMDMKQEVMDDTIDETMAEEGEEEEEEAVINKVLDDIGIDLSQALVDAPTSGAQSTSEKHKVGVAVGGDNADNSSASNASNSTNNKKGPGAGGAGGGGASGGGGGGGVAAGGAGGGGGGGGAPGENAADDSFESDLQARLDALRR